jgi:hypothetical protein
VDGGRRVGRRVLGGQRQAQRDLVLGHELLALDLELLHPGVEDVDRDLGAGVVPEHVPPRLQRAGEPALDVEQPALELPDRGLDHLTGRDDRAQLVGQLGHRTGDREDLDRHPGRQRTDIFKDLTTKGELTGVTVQPVGHLHIITSSSEYHTFQGCNPGEAVCNEACVDVQYDNDNCGACNKKCSGEDECQEGTCNGIDACNACAADSETGTCKAENDACNADPACKSFETCFTGCQDQQCQSDCVEGVPQDVLEKYDAQIYCICDEACVGECAGLCG